MELGARCMAHVIKPVNHNVKAVTIVFFRAGLFQFNLCNNSSRIGGHIPT